MSILAQKIFCQAPCGTVGKALACLLRRQDLAGRQRPLFVFVPSTLAGSHEDIWQTSSFSTSTTNFSPVGRTSLRVYQAPHSPWEGERDWNPGEVQSSP